jgi:fatty-acyl-CoA synthase
MWPHRSLLISWAGSFKVLGLPLPATIDELVAGISSVSAEARQRILPAAPLMHGTAAMTAMSALSAGGTVVTMSNRSFDAAAMWNEIEARRVTHATIVGDAFAKPMCAALDQAAADGESFDVSSLRVIYSSGTMWSAPVKAALLERADLVLVDLVGSSEGVGFASSVTKRSRSTATARFKLGEYAQVLTEDGRPVEPGSGEVGVLAVGGPIPVGYYKDPEKTAATFRRIGGAVWSVPGDHAQVEMDGTIRLLGRGSVCINTGGEKVFPEEVEEALKTHPGVVDCNVVGLPDEKWGQAITAVVEAVPGAVPTQAELKAHIREGLAGYKVPKAVVFVARLQRSPNGKSDYRWATATATAALGHQPD